MISGIDVKVDKPYKLHIGSGIIKELPKILKTLGDYDKIMVVTDSNVEKLYLDKVLNILKGNKVFSHTFAFGETSKSLTEAENIYKDLIENTFTRGDLIIALGGGVVGDVTGFVASTYLRGVDFIQVPTTLLAMIDSSIGGKTAVNTTFGKNLVGTFYQPRAVIMDIDFLKTLNKEEMKNGYGELIKYAVLKNDGLYQKIVNNDIEKDLFDIIKTCASIKVDVVEQDTLDKGLRALLNLGHTFAHAIEKCSSYGISHGKAVYMGTLLITDFAINNGICDKALKEQLLKMGEQLDMENESGFTFNELIKFVKVDKKTLADSISLVLPKKLGECVVKKYKLDELKSMWK